MELLLFSNSTIHGRGYLEHASEVVADYLQEVNSLVFVPYALADHDAYTAKVADALAPHGVNVTGLHTAADPAQQLAGADAIFVGGGNTFRLVKTLQEGGLQEPLRAAAVSGTRYMGASAGTNIAAPSLRTTNDMPIVQPPSFRTLNLIPFQINAHYLDADPTSTHAGETRGARLLEFLEENDVPVLGLREGTHLRVSGKGEAVKATIGGTAVSPSAPGPAVLYRRRHPAIEVDDDVSWLFASVSGFDIPDTY